MNPHNIFPFPGFPEGEEGGDMLKKMNEHHYELTGWALEKAAFGASDSILDIGCGGGMTLKRLGEMLPGAKLYGMDYSPAAISATSELNRDLIDSGRLQLTQASVEKIPYRDDFFDKIITVETFYFWPDPREDLREVFRVLRPGGVFLLAAEIYGGIELCPSSVENVERYGLYNPTSDEFEELFRKAGFSFVEDFFKDGEEWICVKGSK